MESQMVSEFILRTGANPDDAVSCLETWGWDLKRAVTDYNDTTTLNLGNEKTLKTNHHLLTESGKPIIEAAKTDDILCSSEKEEDFKDIVIKKKPILTKSDTIDISDYRKLSRGISRATDNINLVSRARTEIAMDFHSNCQKSTEQPHSLDTPDFTFILPNIFNYSSGFRAFLEKDLIECSTLNALEQTRRLNWWADSGSCRKLWPLATTGDGNCLLHAASLGMWGFHDRKLTLRSALYSILSNGSCRNALWRRWRFQQTRFNRNAGFDYSEEEWGREWDEIVAMSSPEPRRNSGGGPNNSLTEKDSNRRRKSTDRNSFIVGEDSATYESLEEIHILALAHILRRTIIVISDTVLRDLNGEAMAPIPFGGIYLPFEISPKECNRGPLLLAYDMAHFSALVPMEIDNDYPPTLVPLTDCDNVLLPIQFCIDPGEDFMWSEYDGNEGNWALTDREHIALLKEYLDIVYVTNTGSPEEEIYEDLTDEEFDKKFTESEVVIPSSNNSVNNLTSDDNQGNNKSSRAAKQLQNVAKQFGSIGKSMSKKIKKNIGSITKIGVASTGGNNKAILPKKNSNLPSRNSTQSFTCTRLLCARLRVRRHDFQEEMIRNYIECARTRFLDLEKGKEKRSSNEQEKQLELLSIDGTVPSTTLLEDSTSLNRNSGEYAVYCINTGCRNYATSETSYLCLECYEKQREKENAAFLNSAPRYDTGRSKFYTQADPLSHERVRNLPPVRRLNELDQTLYLSNSTFFNDKLPSNTYHHGYSPTTVKLTDESDEYPPQSVPLGTVSVFSPGNTSTATSNVSKIKSPTFNHQNPRQKLTLEDRLLMGNHEDITHMDLIDNFEEDEDGPYRNPHQHHLNSHQYHIDNHPNILIDHPQEHLQVKPCRTSGCLFFGTSCTNFYCSKCCLMMKNTNNSNTIDSNASSISLTSVSSPPPNNTFSSSFFKPDVGATTVTQIYPNSNTSGTATAAVPKSGSKIMSDI